MLLFARCIVYDHLVEYVRGLKMRVCWVQDYTKVSCKNEIDAARTKDVVFLQMGPTLTLLQYLRENGFQVWILNTEQFSRHNRIASLENVSTTVVPFEKKERKEHEQVAFDFEKHILTHLRRGVHLMDYSQTNIDIIRCIADANDMSLVQTKLSCFVSLPTATLCCYFEESISNRDSTSVCFVGDTHSAYRRNVLDKMPFVKQLQNVFGAQRDRQLYANGILLNVHYGPAYNVFEEIRCVPCVLAKMIVVSETSLIDKKHPIFPFIIFVPYDSLENAVITVRNNYQSLHTALFHNNPKFETLREDIIQYEQSQNAQKNTT